MARLYRADRKATVTQITNLYFLIHNTSNLEAEAAAEDHNECHFCQLRTGQRLQFTQAHQNWTIDDWMLPGRMSLDFCCNILVVGSAFWSKQHKSMDPSCLVLMVQAGCGGVMVCGVFSWHTLGPLVPTEL